MWTTSPWTPPAAGRGWARPWSRPFGRRPEPGAGEFLSLEVRPSNTGAIVLYTGLGFQSVGRRKNFYTQPVEDALLLTLGLGEEEALC